MSPWRRRGSGRRSGWRRAVMANVSHGDSAIPSAKSGSAPIPSPAVRAAHRECAYAATAPYARSMPAAPRIRVVSIESTCPPACSCDRLDCELTREHTLVFGCAPTSDTNTDDFPSTRAALDHAPGRVLPAGHSPGLAPPPVPRGGHDRAPDRAHYSAGPPLPWRPRRSVPSPDRSPPLVRPTSASVSEKRRTGRANWRTSPASYLRTMVIPESCSHRDGGLHGHQNLPGHDHEARHG